MADGAEHVTQADGDLPPEVQSAPPEAHFGPFVRLEKLGAGGMGEVWKAWDTGRAHWVALKLLADGPAVTDDWVTRFRREASAASRLDHPGVVNVYEVGVCDGRHFIAMELIAGTTLEALVSPTGCPPAKALEVVAEVADALAFSHAKGVLHRDLKPGNILIEGGGRVVLTDFGLAFDKDASVVLTQEGEMLGTPAYMSPEQARGVRDQIGAHSDVYGLGAVLYELLTGYPPFQGDSPFKVLYDVVSEDPVKPSTLMDGIPADAEALCLAALAKRPADRPKSAAQFRDACRRAAGKAVPKQSKCATDEGGGGPTLSAPTPGRIPQADRDLSEQRGCLRFW
ncbi:MAG: serine/threonine-protein kinase [Planctomycetota bacterium]|jgi:serine/threonine-protein kinase